MRNFTVKFLLFALFNTTIFGMEQPAPLYVLATAFHPIQKRIALLCSDISIKIWDRTNNDIEDISLDSIKKEFDKQNIHSIEYDRDNLNKLLITLYEPSGREGICVGMQDLVTAKTLTFNIAVTERYEKSLVIENFVQNKRANNAVHILKSPRTIIGYKKDKRLFNDIVKNIQSYALHPSDNNPIVAVGLDNQTDLYNLATWEPFCILPHPGTHSTTLNFNHDGTQFLIGKNNGCVDFYSLQTTFYSPTKDRPPIENLILTPGETININPIQKQDNLIKQIFLNPLSALKALYHNTSFTAKTFTTIAGLAGIGAIWLYYTKYITSRA